MSETRFCEGGHMQSCLLTRVSIRRASLVQFCMFCLNNVIKYYQRAKKVVSDSPGLVDFAIGLVARQKASGAS